MTKQGYITVKDNKVAFYGNNDKDLVEVLVKYNNEKLVATVASYTEAQKAINAINSKGVDIVSKIIAKKQADNYFLA